MDVKSIWDLDYYFDIGELICSLAGVDCSKLNQFHDTSTAKAWLRDRMNSTRFGKKLCFNMSHIEDIRSDVEARADFQLFYCGEDINPEQISAACSHFGEHQMWCLVHAKDKQLHASHEVGPHKYSLCWLVLLDEDELYRDLDEIRPLYIFQALMNKHQMDEQYGWPYIYAIQWNKAINENLSEYRTYLSNNDIFGTFNNYLFATIAPGLGEYYVEPRYRT